MCIDALGNIAIRMKEMFLSIEKKTKQGGLTINDDKFKYIHVNCRVG